MRSRRLALRAFCSVIALASSVASAQTTKAPETFGSSPVAHTLQAFGFVPFSQLQSDNVQGTAHGSRFCNGGPNCFWESPLLLPSGAVIDSIILDGCDTHMTGDLNFQLRQIGTMESSNTQIATGGTSGQPGCTLVTATPAAPPTVDNVAYSYWVEVSSGPTGGELRFQAVRVMYHLQVSPTPLTATFNDVPVGHPFHRFIEAFARAGITGGCNQTPPLFCPNDPVTRGQMAVFMSAALGLHWTP